VPSDEQYREQFRQNGYVVIEQAVEKGTVERMFRDVSALLEEALANVGLAGQADSVDDKYALLKRRFSKLKSHAYDLIGYLESVQLAARTGRLIDALHALSDRPFLIDRVQLRVDDASNDRLLPLHQEVYGQISWDCLNAWVPLVPVSNNRGALRVLPGSHRAGHVRHRFYREFNDSHGICEGEIDERGVVSPAMASGDAVIFHPLLVHGSGINTGDSTRWTLVARYNPVQRIPYLEGEDNPLHIQQLDAPEHGG
jgi:phytanoyl-CoA hydroxylase